MMTYSQQRMSFFVDELKNLNLHGYAKLRGVFNYEQVIEAREQVERHVKLLRKTRPNRNSLHLAGFHRYIEFELLHALITQNATISNFLNSTSQGTIRTIGLSDITVDRSQEWHKDLLRGKFQQHLASKTPCRDYSGSVYKVIWYLQPSSSLKVARGSHKVDVRLDKDSYAAPSDEVTVDEISTEVGDVVIIDVCLSHRGSEESATAPYRDWKEKRILLSTVFGREGAALTNQMELGNALRLHDWDKRNSLDAAGAVPS